MRVCPSHRSVAMIMAQTTLALETTTSKKEIPLHSSWVVRTSWTPSSSWGISVPTRRESWKSINKTFRQSGVAAEVRVQILTIRLQMPTPTDAKVILTHTLGLRIKQPWWLSRITMRWQALSPKVAILAVLLKLQTNALSILRAWCLAQLLQVLRQSWAALELLSRKEESTSWSRRIWKRTKRRITKPSLGSSWKSIASKKGVKI